jgi:phosphate transport system substrate-binding protein
MRRYRSLCAIAGLVALLATGCSRGPSDAVLAAQIKARFFSDPIVKTSAVSVAVTHGEVTLGGTVSGVSVELQALKLAMGAEGVRKLNDRISVVPLPEPPKPTALAAAPAPRHRQAPAASATAAPPPEAVPEPSPRDRAKAAPAAARGPAPSPTPMRVAVLPGRPIVAPAPAEPASEYAVPVPVPVFVNVAPPAAAPGKAQFQASVTLVAAGPPGPAALFGIWDIGYSKTDAHVRISYQPSDAASPQQTADFGVFDLPIGDERLSRALDLRVVRFPAAVGGVVPICNIGGRLETLNFSGELLAAVFSGSMATWDNIAIRILNPQTALPVAPITVIHRSDASDETWLFTDYLSEMSPDWKARIGGSPSVKWPAGHGGAGNAGVLRLVGGTPNSIGYVDASFARQNGLRWCAVQNRAGSLVKASPESLTAAAAGSAAATARDLSASILNSPGPNAYPIASLLWLGVRERLSDANKRDAMRSFLGWMLTQGQPDAAGLGYGPLPAALVRRAQAQIGRVQ